VWWLLLLFVWCGGCGGFVVGVFGFDGVVLVLCGSFVWFWFSLWCVVLLCGVVLCVGCDFVAVLVVVCLVCTCCVVWCCVCFCVVCGGVVLVVFCLVWVLYVVVFVFWLGVCGLCLFCSVGVF
jgi:hypothetical protein